MNVQESLVVSTCTVNHAQENHEVTTLTEADFSKPEAGPWMVVAILQPPHR